MSVTVDSNDKVFMVGKSIKRSGMTRSLHHTLYDYTHIAQTLCFFKGDVFWLNILKSDSAL